MHSLFKALQKGARGIGTKNDVKRALNNVTRTNISCDKQVSRKFPLNSDLRDIARDGDFILVLEDLHLSLINISRKRPVWSINVENRNGYRHLSRHNTLQLTAEGYALYITQNSEGPPSISYNVQIFHKGVKIGDFLIQEASFNVFSLRMVHGRILGIAHFEDAAYFHEWNINGELVNTIPMDSMKSTISLRIECNGEYYIAASKDKHLAEKPQFFVFNLGTNTHQTFDYDESEMRIRSTLLDRTRLICGVSYYYQRPELSNWGQLRKPKICVYNIITGEMEAEYVQTYEEGQITHLIANRDFIVFLQDVYYESGPNDLYSLNRNTGEIKVLKAIPKSDFPHLSLSLHANCVVVCFTQGSCDPDFITTMQNGLRRLVIDLNTGEHLGQDILYNRALFFPPSFANGKLVIPRDHIDQSAIYVEDYMVSSAEEPDAADSARAITSMSPT